MGGGTTTTQTSGLSNPAMNTAATTIGNQLNTQLKAGVTPYTQSMVPGLSGQTQAGMGGLANNPNNSIFSGGVGTALGQQSDIATGNLADDPYRNRIINDVSTNTSAVMQGSGRFGSGSHENALNDNVAGALAPYDYGRQQQAIQNMGSLYSMSQAPASAQLQAGQIQDAWNAASAEDKARIFDATNNAGWNTLQRGASIFSGTAPVSGTTQTNTQQVPWWQSALGVGAGLASFL
jgi:hypothetical protein